MSFLIGRMMLVLLSAAKINDESKVPIGILRGLPDAGYGKEVCKINFF